MASVAKAIKEAFKATGYSELRDYQKKTIEAYLSGRDVFVSAPTGAGKSLTFELAPYAFDYLLGEDSNAIVLVVVPLISLMKDQVSNLNSRGIPASYVGDDCCEQQLQDILDLKDKLVFGSPEAILNNYRHIFRRLKNNLKCVFIDESHCIAKWGKDSATEEAFRRDYGRLAELRSLLHREVPFVALTATATEATKKTIIKDLCMLNCVQILGDPNKPNIRYTVVDIDHGNLYDTFKTIIDDIDERQLSATKVMVFCRRKEDMKELFELFSQSLGPKAYTRPKGTEPMDDRTRLFAMYHKKTHDLVKRTIETEFCKENGTVRVVFCTIAFGMGINVKGGNVVVHLGPSSGIDDYLQESGRVGRNNESAHAILLRYKGSTRSRNITKEMKEYTKNEIVCRRTLLLKSFTASPSQYQIQHTCCDICADKCKCLCTCGSKECVCEEKCKKSDHQSSFEKLLKHSVSEDKPTSCESESNMQGKKAKVLRDNLLQYRMQLSGNLSSEQLITGLDLATGFSRLLIDSIVSCAREINSIKMLLERFSFFDRSQAEYVWQCLCDLSESSSSDSDNSVMQEISESEDINISTSLVRRHRHYVLDSTDDSE